MSKEFPFKINVIDCARPLINMGSVGSTAFTYTINDPSMVIPVPTYTITNGAGCPPIVPIKELMNA